MSRYKISDDTFKKYVAESISIRQIILKMEHVPTGGNYETINNRIKKMKLSTTHFLGKAANRGQFFGPKRDINEYLSNKYPIASDTLKKRLIREGYFKHQCYNCHNLVWLGVPIPIELEHIDGNHNNNELSNLTILCPNCHSLTATHCRQKSSLKV